MGFITTLTIQELLQLSLSKFDISDKRQHIDSIYYIDVMIYDTIDLQVWLTLLYVSLIYTVQEFWGPSSANLRPLQAILPSSRGYNPLISVMQTFALFLQK